MILAKIPKDKRKPLCLTIVGVIAALGVIGYGLIRNQYHNLNTLAQKQIAVETQLEQMRNAVKRANEIETDVVTLKAELAAAETNMGSGDLYAWFVDTLRRFKS